MKITKQIMLRAVKIIPNVESVMFLSPPSVLGDQETEITGILAIAIIAAKNM